MNDDVDIQFFYLKYRPYTTVANGAEMMKLIDSSFISPLDVVYNEEEEIYFVHDAHGGFEMLSKGNQHWTQATFFHYLNIGETFKLGEKEYSVVNISFDMATEEAYYTLKEEGTNTTTKILVSIIDSNFVEHGVPMQSVMLEEACKCFS